MKLTISQKIEPIKTLGCYKVIESFQDNRLVFIDGKQVPSVLATIILLGLDSLTSDYIKQELMRKLEAGE